MKIYFTASITGKKHYEKNYRLIVNTLRSLGHKLILNHLFERTAVEVWGQSEEIDKVFCKLLMGWLKECDLVIAEVTYPSIGVGFEIAFALNKLKPVLALYSSEQPVPLLKGMEGDQLIIERYEPENLKASLKNLLKLLSEKIDTRFTLLLPTNIVSFLDELSKKKKIPRSVFIRSLIEREMKGEK